MATNYGKKNMGRGNSSSGIGSLMLAFVAFVFGYLIATVFGSNQLSSWFNTQVLARQTTQLPGQATNQQAQITKPKFEFYTLLAKDQTVRPIPSPPPTQSTQPATVPAQITETATPTAPMDLTVTQKLPLHEPLVTTQPVTKPAPVATVTASAERFMVQVGSFKNLHEAEKMKASLVMKGFEVAISVTNQQHVNWYRVIIGPFASRIQAQKAQLAFAQKEHIVGMVRKMDA